MQGLLTFMLPNTAALVICMHAGLIMENAIMDLLPGFSWGSVTISMSFPSYVWEYLCEHKLMWILDNFEVACEILQCTYIHEIMTSLNDIFMLMSIYINTLAYLLKLESKLFKPADSCTLTDFGLYT